MGLQLISSSSWFIGLVVTVPRWILFSQEGMCMYLVCPEHMVLLPLPGAAGWCSCSAQTEHPCMQGTHGWQCWDAHGWMFRDARGAGMLRLDVEGCLWLAVQGCSWYRDAQTCSAGRLMAQGCLQPAVWGCDFPGRGEGTRVCDTGPAERYIFSRRLWQGGGSPVIDLSVPHRDKGLLWRTSAVAMLGGQNWGGCVTVKALLFGA